jgi:GTP-binding protein
MKPSLVIVGRPNVGKSTLFNRLTRSRDALVADQPGLTRDRHYGHGRLGNKPYLVVDTGGFEPQAKEGIVHEMARQAEAAIAEADVLIFVVDVRTGLTSQDKVIADLLRRSGRPVLLAANKGEGMDRAVVAAEFYELGCGDPCVISSAHGEGVRELVELALAPFPDESEADDDAAGPRVAIAGRPNVGKSTLVNTLLGEERVIAFDMPGTTRDAIEVPFERNGRAYTLIDTAGLRRKGRVFETIEKFSVIKTLQAIEEANVVVLMVDATPGHFRSGCAHRRLLPSTPGGPWWLQSINGMRWTTIAASRSSWMSRASSTSSALPAYTMSLHSKARGSPASLARWTRPTPPRWRR